jgi:tRNA(adenine34) deaminase
MENFMEAALEEAEIAAQLDEVPVGAVIVKNSIIIASAHNLREQSQDPTNHAEILALKIASRQLGRWRLDDCDLYVTKEPCPMCAGAIFQARIKKLVFGAKDKKAGYAGTLYNVAQDKRLNWQTEVTSGILEEESRKLLQDFFKSKRKNK